MVGRNRSFDTDEVLESLMQTFWRNGYAGTSMSDLTKASGLTKPSLYGAFGNKEAIFQLVLERYIEGRFRVVARTLAANDSDLKTRIKNYLMASVRDATDPNLPGGCFFLCSTCDVASNSLPQSIRDQVNSVSESTNLWMVRFFAGESKRGNLPKHMSPRLMAVWLSTLQSGLVATAQRGIKRDVLAKVITQSLTLLTPRDRHD